MKLEILEKCDNANVQAALAKAENVLAQYKKIAVSISGGADSDVMLDMIEKVKTDYNEVTYYFIDTRMEFQATKDHLDYLEDRYGVKIERVKAKTPIPTAVKKNGIESVFEYIDYMSSADVEEMRHGEWIASPVRQCSRRNTNHKKYHCSECGKDVGNRPNYKRCPECGAKMDGGTQ